MKITGQSEHPGFVVVIKVAFKGILKVPKLFYDLSYEGNQELCVVLD